MAEQRCLDLRVEYLDEPIAIGVDRPRFSWTVAHAQVGYELEVEDASGRSVWTSGRVADASTSLILYAGEPLGSNAAYSWRVRSWTAHEETTEWATSTFGTALLDAAQWHATWVRPAQESTVIERWSLFDWIRGATPDGPPDERLRPVQLLRQLFRVDAPVARARLYATAHGVYSAQVNGDDVDDQILAPGFDSYTHRLSVQCYDVTDSIAQGENVLAVALADGWWAGRIGLTGSSAQFGDTTEAIWQLHLDHPDGATTVIASGQDVVGAPGPWDYSDLFVGERFDRRALAAGWNRPGFDDSGWTPVTVSGADHSTLRPFTGEPIRRLLELTAVRVDEVGDGSVIVDFGQVIAGRVRLTLRSPRAGRQIVIEHTETLDAEGAWFVNIAGINKEQTDVYIAAGDPEETWEPSFTFHGFRYARIRGADGLSADDIVAVVIGSDLEQTGSFVTSDERLNRLHQNVVWSQRANFLSVPTDCPQREKVGWTGDILVFAASATRNAQVVPFLSRWLENLRADQLPDGRIPITSPRSPFDAEAADAAQGIGAIVAAAGWSDAIAFVPWALYERTGDRRVLEDAYPAILRWIEYQSARAASELPPALAELGDALPAERRAAQSLLYNTGDHFGDWLTPSTLEGRPLHEAIGIAPALTTEYVAPIFQAQTLSIAASIAGVLGRAHDEAALASHAIEVRRAFASEYVDADGRLPVELQGLYTLALAFDLVPTDLRASAAERLARLVRDRDGRLDTGFLSVPYLLEVLWETGHRDLARTVLWQDQQPSWLFEVDHGATTIWEAWDAVSPDGTVRPVSLNHYAFGCVDEWLYGRVAGIRSTSPGYLTAVIEPDFDAGVDEVHAYVGTPSGRLAVDWTRDAESITATVSVPHGVSAELVMPDGRRQLPPGRTTHITRRDEGVLT